MRSWRKEKGKRRRDSIARNVKFKKRKKRGRRC